MVKVEAPRHEISLTDFGLVNRMNGNEHAVFLVTLRKELDNTCMYNK